MKKTRKNTIQYIKLNKEILLYLLFFISSIVLSFLGIKSGFYFVALLLGFGWSLFFFKSKLNILEHFLVAPVIFSVLLIFLTCSVSLLGIKITIILLCVFSLVSLALFIYSGIFKSLSFSVKKWDFVVLFIYIVAIVAKVYSLREFNAIPLHDPITHSYFAKSIVRTGFINYFYSPGLHIISAFGEMSNGFNAVKQVLFLSNFFGVCLGTMSYLFIKHYFAKPVWGVLACLLFSIGYYPILFFFNAGKNALVMGLTALMFFCFASTLNLSTRSRKLYILSNLILASIFLIHYPTAVFACAFSAAIFIVYFKNLKWEGLLYLIGMFVGLIWLVFTWKYKVIDASLSLGKDSDPFSYVSKASSLWESFVFYIKSIWGSIRPIKGKFRELPRALWFLGLFFFTSNFLLYSKARRSKFFLLFIWMLIQFLIFAFVTVLKISTLGIAFETFLLSLGMYIYIFSAYIFYKIYESLIRIFRSNRLIDTLAILSISIVSIIGGVHMYKKCYVDMRKGDIVNKQDYEAFIWVDKNLEDSDIILINAIGGDGLVFSSDSGGWLEVFSGSQITMPFYRYGYLTTDENLKIYKELSKDISNCHAREKFLNKGVGYYFDGSNQFFGPPLASEENLKNNNGYKLIYSNEGVEIYKLLGCPNENFNNNNKF